MKHSLRLSSLLILVPLLLFAAGAVQAGSRGSAAAALVKTAPGHMLVNAKGMTLYIFSKDVKGVSACTGGCASAWPPLMVPKGAKVPAAMTGIPGKFGESMSAAGAQLTYDGSPLYTFASDMKPGDVNGEGIADAWWAVVVPSGM